MIEKIKTNEKEEFYSSIPCLKKFNDVTLQRGDTLVLYMDFDKYDIEEMEQWMNIVQSMFPLNQVMIIPLGSEIGVITERRENE